MPGRGFFNQLIQPQDQITIHGNVVSTSGALGSLLNVVIAPQSNPSAVFTAYASDSYAPATNGPGLTADAQQSFNPGDQTSTPAVVQSISGSGAQATLTAILNSGLVVSVPAASCSSANQTGGN